MDTPNVAQCPTGTFGYTVAAGDSYYSLAVRYNTTIQAIIDANPGIDPNFLRIGQVICIPRTTTPSCPANTFAYTIVGGDTLYSLAARYNTTVQAIVAANPGIDPNYLRIGQIICIPRTSSPAPCPPNTFSYTIVGGDTLYSLAARYNTTVQAITDVNPGIDPNSLRIGQIICIPRTTPSACPSGTTAYTIVAGDTLYSIAIRYSTTVQAILAVNPSINPNNLQVGQRICVPAAAPQPCPQGSVPYIIQSGDTFYSIALRYNTTVEALIRVNPNVNPNALAIGQRICIPTS